jgi:hypothetical protein
MSASAVTRASRATGGALLGVALLISVMVGARGITRDGTFFMKGDAPRYLMNGVFLYDLIGSGTAWNLEALRTYGERYYARYPALSLGHHMPLLPLVLVPFYAVFGVSVFAARLAVLTSFVLSVLLLYRLVRRLFDERVAGWACLLFATSPVLGTFGQRVLSEMPANALVLATLNGLLSFRHSGRLRDYFLMVAAAVASLLCRPTAVYMLPAYGVLLLLGGGSRHFRKRGVATVTVLGFAAVCAAIVVMASLSPFNTGFVGHIVSQGLQGASIRAVLSTAVQEPPLFVAMFAGLAASVVNRDGRMWVPVIWMASVLACATFLTGAIEASRYSILAVPAYCIAAAALSAGLQGRFRTACAALLATACAWQLWVGSRTASSETPGYEAAAAYVTSLGPTPTILYSASVDTGYFVFFVRKHDPAQHLVVLRADKLLTTSLMARLSIEDLIDAPTDIYPLLHRYGTRFVVIEDRPGGGMVLDWLSSELRTERFVERRRFLIGEGHPQLRGVSLVVFEYRDALGPAPDAELDLHLPLVGRRIKVPLIDLLQPAASR